MVFGFLWFSELFGAFRSSWVGFLERKGDLRVSFVRGSQKQVVRRTNLPVLTNTPLGPLILHPTFG